MTHPIHLVNSPSSKKMFGTLTFVAAVAADGLNGYTGGNMNGQY